MISNIIIYNRVKFVILAHHKNLIVHHHQAIHRKSIVQVKEYKNSKALKNLNKVTLYYTVEIDEKNINLKVLIENRIAIQLGIMQFGHTSYGIRTSVASIFQFIRSFYTYLRSINPII
jgi:hypothetical protein